MTHRWRTKCFLTQVTPRGRRADSLLQCIIHRLSLSFKVAIELVHVLMEAIVGVKGICRKRNNTIWVPTFLTFHRCNTRISPVFFLKKILEDISPFGETQKQKEPPCFETQVKCVSSSACNELLRIIAGATPDDLLV